MIPNGTTPGIGGGGRRRMVEGSEFMYDIFDTLCVKATMYPHPS
jgi:hypothetical protein